MMLTTKNLINALKEYKFSAFLNNPANKGIIKGFLRDTLKLCTYEGQKRVVVDHPEDQSKVLKIGCTEDGIWDNAAENIMYNTIKRYHMNNIPIGQNDFITQQDMLLFPETQLLENDPFILVSEKVYTSETLPEYKEWKETQGRNLYASNSFTDGYLWTAFLLHYKDPLTGRNILKEDLDRAFKILSNISIHSDLGYESPFNKGVRKVGSTLRVVILDMGSCLPIIDNVQRPKCTACADNSGLLSYVSFVDLDPSKLDIIEISNLKGFYGCSNPSCQHNHAAVYNSFRQKGGIPNELLDVNVYNNFLMDIKFRPNLYPSYIKLFYLDSSLANIPIGLNKEDVYNYLLQVGLTKEELSEVGRFKVVYENHVFKTVATIINSSYVTTGMQNNLYNYIFNPNNPQAINSGALSFSNFKGNIANILASYNITGANIICKISAIMYLSIIINSFKQTNNSIENTFYAYYEINDVNVFLSTMAFYYQMYGNDIVDLFNNLKL